jgi:beta-lactamase class D
VSVLELEASAVRASFFSWALAALVVLIQGAALSGCSRADAVSERRDLSPYFGEYEGAFVLYDASHDRWLRHDPEACRSRVMPCSTFKILNSLIALESGAASGPDFRLDWDGTPQYVKACNGDLTLAEAFRHSCLWFYEELAARTGMERIQKHVDATGYGNRDLSSGLPHFWLQGSLAVSPDEQVDLLRRLHAGDLPFSERAAETVLQIMTLWSREGIVFRGKTGTGGDATRDAATLGWFVGSVSTPAGDYFFATRIIGGENPSGRTARAITEAILESLEILPRQ